MKNDLNNKKVVLMLMFAVQKKIWKGAISVGVTFSKWKGPSARQKTMEKNFD